ncbi:WhiB family transcriptional regulator [Mycolicibacterium cosmeticum]|uniref:WhiB family transcriptional regulator n=1 Tax=Mycolicibacterium cosmeticum TaxID=258533 RepID=UPI002795344F|nr:WhiB family transcriptional regulator [Mycolicibacterium cosmeticum]
MREPHIRCRGDSRARGLMHAQWRLRARCRGMSADIFFPPDHESRVRRAEREEAAKRICRACAVQAKCFDHAVKNVEPHGIWGGTTPGERRRLERQAGE